MIEDARIILRLMSQGYLFQMMIQAVNASIIFIASSFFLEKGLTIPLNSLKINVSFPKISSHFFIEASTVVRLPAWIFIFS